MLCPQSTDGSSLIRFTLQSLGLSVNLCKAQAIIKHINTLWDWWVEWWHSDKKTKYTWPPHPPMHSVARNRLKITCCCAHSKTKRVRLCVGQWQIIPQQYNYKVGNNDHPNSVCDMTVVSGMSDEMKPESVSLHPLGKAAAPVPELLCIFGIGDFRALSRPASAPVWLQGGVQQPQTSQLWPLAFGSSGTSHCNTTHLEKM